ncbi:hypothetical protein [uncultured Psychroserpens sp.]|uniref:hypothetical protein n=1 Tax=uncultured Psychroserpens sp. TaxID=255436 RepID=UPI0026262B49|nr:hypothetical protein [uncultured Psychroserpens sp.]
MNNSYRILFDLLVTHTYFKTGFCEGLTYKPSKSTSELMDRFNLKVLNIDKGFQFYSRGKVPFDTFLNYITKATEHSYFEFNAQSTDQVFYQYTNLPLDDIKTLLFDSEQSHAEGDFIVLNQQFQKRSANLFTLRIQFSDILMHLAKDAIGHYRIDFSSRATKWQYTIINNSQEHYNELSIKSNSEVEFDSGKEVVLNNGQKAIAFTSIGDNIVLSQIPKHTFDLVCTESEMGVKISRILFKGLPMPIPSQLQVIKTNTEMSMVSPIYIYL